MATKTGRPGTLTPRDIELMRALAFCPLLNARQIMKLDLPGPEYTNLSHLMEQERQNKLRLATRGFSSYERCRKSLYRLAKKGFLARYANSASELTMWSLTPEGHKDVVHNRLWLEKTYNIDLPYNDYRPDPTRVRHHEAVGDLFVALQPRLTDLYGELPSWDWMSERRAFETYRVGGEPRRYMPDAELVLGEEDFVFVIERQTRYARKAEADIKHKIERHHERLTGNRRRTEDDFQIIFSCDEQRDIDYALRTAEALGLARIVVADFPEVIAQHIREVASDRSRAPGKHKTYTTGQFAEQTNGPAHLNGHPTTDWQTHGGNDNGHLDIDPDQFEEVPF